MWNVIIGEDKEVALFVVSDYKMMTELTKLFYVTGNVESINLPALQHAWIDPEAEKKKHTVWLVLLQIKSVVKGLHINLPPTAQQYIDSRWMVLGMGLRSHVLKKLKDKTEATKKQQHKVLLVWKWKGIERLKYLGYRKRRIN